MNVVVSTHQGVLYNEEVDYVVVHSDTDGEYACLKDHVPVISVMDTGYIKLVKDKEGNPTLMPTKLIIAKQRNGETGEFKIGFRPVTASFENIDQNVSL